MSFFAPVWVFELTKRFETSLEVRGIVDKSTELLGIVGKSTELLGIVDKLTGVRGIVGTQIGYQERHQTWLAQSYRSIVAQEIGNNRQQNSKLQNENPQVGKVFPSRESLVVDWVTTWIENPIES